MFSLPLPGAPEKFEPWSGTFQKPAPKLRRLLPNACDELQGKVLRTSLLAALAIFHIWEKEVIKARSKINHK